LPEKILVTGGSGRLGALLCPFLKEKGYKVTNFDLNPPPVGSPAAGIPFVKGDFCNLGECLRAISLAQADAIVHLGAIPYNTELLPPHALDYDPAAYSGLRYAQRMPEDSTMRINTMGTFYVYDAARRLGVKDVVAASSYFTLGIGFRLSGTSYEPAYLPMDELHPSLPEDSYSLSKMLGEEIGRAFARAYGIRSIALRLLGVYFDYLDPSGSGRSRHGAPVPQAEGSELDMLNGNTYQYVDARDICNIIDLSLQKIGSPELEPFEPFFVATDTIYKESTRDVIAKRWPRLAEMGAGIEGSDGLISIEKARRLLGYVPQFSWRDAK
jgi:nucleoside-diphosphate-sugar epimerase